MGEFVITGGHLVLPAGEGRVKVQAGDLFISGGEIAEVAGPGAPADSGSIKTVDATGCAVMPGLVNAHCHGAMSLFRGYADDLPLMRWLEEWIWPAEAHLTPEDVYWGTALAALEMLRGGVTTFADMYFHMDEAARATADLGMRGILSEGLIGIKRGGQEDLHRSRALFERWHGSAGGRLQVQLGPHAPYTCPPEYMEQVISLARELGCGIHIHVAETTDEVEEIRQEYGMSPVQYLDRVGLLDGLPLIAAHCVYVDEEDLRLLKAAGVGVVHCPGSNQKLGSGVAPLGQMLEAGVTVGLGTDGACSTGRLDLWSEMRAAALMQKAVHRDPERIPAATMLYLATRGGAKACGLEDVGELSVGMKADLAIVDLSAPHLVPHHDILSLLAYSAGPSDVRDVYVEGQPVVSGRCTVRLSEQGIVQKALMAAEDLVGRVGSV